MVKRVFGSLAENKLDEDILKFKGAEILIVNISKKEVIDEVMGFIASNDLIIEKNHSDDDVTTIRVTNPIDSYLKLWWKRIPQVIEWRLIDLMDEETRVEIRFGLQRKFKNWYWSIFVGLILLFLLTYELNTIIRKKVTIDIVPEQGVCYLNLYVLTLAITVMLIILSLIFAGFPLTAATRYEHFIKSLKEYLKSKKGIFFQKTLQSSHTFPYVIEVFAVLLLMISLFIFRNRTSMLLSDDIGIALSFLILLIFALVGMLLIGLRTTGFMERNSFIVIGIRVTFSLLIIYGIPYVNFYSIELKPLYQTFLKIDHHVNDRSSTESSLNNDIIFKQKVRIYILGKLGIYLIIFLIGLTIFYDTPKLARAVKRLREEFFRNASVDSIYRKALEFSDFSRKLFLSILSLWVILSVGTYWVIFVSFSVLEYNILGTNFIFLNRIGERFCEDFIVTLKFLLMPSVPEGIVIFIGRTVILIYVLPIVLIVFQVLKKRLAGHLSNKREFKRHTLKQEDDELNLFELIQEMARDIQIKSPQIVLIPSKVLKMNAKYVGFPFFKSCISISKTCEKLKYSELQGLLAHEMFHIKRHSFRRYLLNLMSDYTIFGNGFLAVLVNSYINELDADDYAVSWLGKNKIPASNFIAGLQALALSASIFQKKEISDGLELRGEEIFERSIKTKRSFINTLREDITILLEIFFGDEILSYIHPPLEERIARIKHIAVN